MTIQIFKPDAINSVQTFLTAWKFNKIPCRAPMDFLISEHLLRVTRRTKHYRLYAKRYGSRMLPLTKYFLLLNSELYCSEVPYGGQTQNIINELESVLQKKKQKKDGDF